MATKVGRVLVHKPLRLQRLQRTTREKWGELKYTYLARVSGVIKLSGKNLYWVHDPSGTDSNGNTIYGAPYKLPGASGAAIYERANMKVKLRRENGVLKIVGTDETEAERVGLDLSESNILNPRRQFTLLEHISNGQAFVTPSAPTTVQVNQTIYRKTDGTFSYIPMTSGIDIVTGNTPSSNTQVVVALWWDDITSAVVQTVSSELSADTDLSLIANLASGITLVNECAASAPYDAPGITSFLLFDDGTFQKFHDLRGIYGSSGGSLQGFPNPVSSTKVVTAGYQEYTYGKITVTGKLTVNGRLRIAA